MGASDLEGNGEAVGPHAPRATTARTTKARLMARARSGENTPASRPSENGSQLISDETECQTAGGVLSSLVMTTASLDTRLAAGGRRRPDQRVVLAEALTSAKPDVCGEG